MAKIATDLEQSKKLAKILPVESADMVYFIDNNTLYPFPPSQANPALPHISAWSLSALMNILPNEIIFELKSYHFKMITDVYSNGEKYYDLGYMGNGYWLEYEDDVDLVDACYKMIIKLHERDILN